MPIFFEDRQIVAPGDLIAEGEYLNGENTYVVDKRIYATRIGLVEYGNNKKVNVVALRALYLPKIGDLIIGKVMEVGFSGWTVDINSPYTGLLRASDVLGKPFRPQKDDLPSIINAGDLIVAKIASYDRMHDPQLTVSESGLGKITRGQIMKLTPSKIPRVIGKKGSMVSAIKKATDCQIVLGMNGVILVNGKSVEAENLALKAIQKIKNESHISGLTARVIKMLDEEKIEKGEINIEKEI